ncbi:MAG: hypothetical protein JOZ90_08950 [Alphaproteobacteria bacterium]|nr:hypothetical protein [Alphaproteobacteria bacterium]MBV9371144.1 hypothetical protein [Alphaproteobacteria bacterium]MBV9901211.1 hypothetical protein [Alphaproteobacteria bacterium]
MAEGDPLAGQAGSARRPQSAAKRIATTLGAAAAAGLTAGLKEKRISVRAHRALFEAAAERSGLEGSELLEYALAKVALEDDFADKLLALKGSVSREIDLEF